MRVRYLRAVELDAEAQAAAESAADDVDRFNRLQQAKALRVIGLDVYVERGVHGHALRALRDRFVRDNVGLIRTIPERHFAQLEAWIKDGVQRGARHETLARELTQRLDAPASRAKLIARDQVSKHNSSLARERQQAVGLTHYRWSATLDARTRPDHFALHDTIQAWDKAPAIGHPGEPIQCRCVAIPVLDPPKTTST
jgi:SPP1 gp7 family putative phage head morphogenesis protein